MFDGGLSRKAILSACDASLRRLGTESIDLSIIPHFDPATPIEETLEALHDLIRVGKVRSIRASNMSAWPCAQALYTADLHGWTRFVSMQLSYNLTYREAEREMLPQCQDQRITVTPWSPLARGFLTRRPDGETARTRTDELGRRLYVRDDDRATAVKVAEARGVPNAQIALAWLLSKPSITAPLMGATQPQHLDDNDFASSRHRRALP